MGYKFGEGVFQQRTLRSSELLSEVRHPVRQQFLEVFRNAHLSNERFLSVTGANRFRCARQSLRTSPYLQRFHAGIRVSNKEPQELVDRAKALFFEVEPFVDGVCR